MMYSHLPFSTKDVRSPPCHNKWCTHLPFTTNDPHSHLPVTTNDVLISMFQDRMYYTSLSQQMMYSHLPVTTNDVLSSPCHNKWFTRLPVTTKDLLVSLSQQRMYSSPCHNKWCTLISLSQQTMYSSPWPTEGLGVSQTHVVIKVVKGRRGVDRNRVPF